MSDPLLSVHISVDYLSKRAVLEDVRFCVHEGEAFGLAGESGSGKSTIALAVLRLLDWRGGRVRGEIRFRGEDLMRLKERRLRRLRGREISLVSQSPVAALNPALRLETQLRETWRVHGETPWQTGRTHVRELFERMGLPSDAGFLSRFPSQISVGQAQRVVLTMAMLHRPSLIVADEPTSALDPGSRQEILELLRSLKIEYGTALLYISHDMASMEGLCDTVHVLKHGRVEDRQVCDRVLI